LLLTYLVKEADDNCTVKYILKEKLKISENLIVKLKSDNRILCNNSPIRVIDHVNYNDSISVNIDFIESNTEITPEPMQLNILFEDECIIVLNKPANTVVHPSILHQEGTIANGLSHYYNQNNIHSKIRPVSRLDKDTTGIIIFAKNQYVQDRLIRQMKSRVFKKEYLGIVFGTPEMQSGTINLPIARKGDSIIERTVCPTGDPSLTHYQVIKSYNQMSLMRFDLETGRTHQIRVHCKAIGHALIGDTLYSEETTNLISRQALHSHKVKFIHPYHNKLVELSAPLPEDIISVIRTLIFNNKKPKE